MTEIPLESPIDPITLRQNEVDQYDQVITLYQQIANNLPSEWPPHLLEYKGRTDTHQAISEINDLNDVQIVCDLWAHDQAQAAIRSNMVERSKAQAILNVLLSQQ